MPSFTLAISFLFSLFYFSRRVTPVELEVEKHLGSRDEPCGPRQQPDLLGDFSTRPFSPSRRDRNFSTYVAQQPRSPPHARRYI